jgi:HD-like signal output (HDOD) protein
MLTSLWRKKVDPQQRLREVLGDEALPSFPAVVLNALQRVREPDCDLSEVANVVANDPGLSVQVLRTVNSAALALRHRVRSVHHAVSLLGRGELESILISIGVRATLPRESTRGYETARFWITSARRAAAASALAEMISPKTRSESFTASLLQDMAIPLLAHRQGGEYGVMLEDWHYGTRDLAVLERENFGWDHAEVGSWMCTEWKFPDQLGAAIRLHHGRETETLPAVHLVAVLREVDDRLGVERLIERAHEQFGLNKDDTAGLVEASLQEAEEISSLFL